ncbi:membrane protein [Terrabacter carboxydivorans]|uniref:Membrane protein n=1 Tax=Terrabacter carboxydivorans TaxID=619730 RepID=A0ABN3KXJ8_9MICO
MPELTALFWVLKILTTGMGETASDYLAHTIGPVIAVCLSGVALVVALAGQLSVRRYVPWLYWTTVAMVSVFGTVAADVAHVGLGVPYAVSTVAFAVALALVLGLWHRTEGTLSVHSIDTTRRELFYWATVLTTFALGTAAGDLTAVTLGLGYLGSAVLFAVAFAVPAVAHLRLGLGAVAAFWTAYVITRPLGASVADWMGVSVARGGLGLGTGVVTLAWAAAIVVIVGLAVVTGRARAAAAD